MAGLGQHLSGAQLNLLWGDLPSLHQGLLVYLGGWGGCPLRLSSGGGQHFLGYLVVLQQGNQCVQVPQTLLGHVSFGIVG